MAAVDVEGNSIMSRVNRVQRLGGLCSIAEKKNYYFTWHPGVSLKPASQQRNTIKKYRRSDPIRCLAVIKLARPSFAYKKQFQPKLLMLHVSRRTCISMKYFCSRSFAAPECNLEILWWRHQTFCQKQLKADLSTRWDISSSFLLLSDNCPL